jgi:hypothetical protein
VKDTRSYFLRKGDDPDAEPSGYVFSTLVEVNGKKVPYILTVNGAALTKSDVEMAVRMVAQDWGSDQVLLPDMEKNPHLVNTTDTREGMKWGGKKATAKFSKGWDIAQKYMDENPAKDLSGNTYRNYYRSADLGEGYLVSVSGSDKRLVEPVQQSVGDVSRYGFGKPAGEEPVLERAILASQALTDAGISSHEQKAVLSHLGVKENEVVAARPLVEMSEKRPLTSAEFHEAEKTLGFDIKGVLARDVGTRALTLRALYEKEPALLAEHLKLGSERLVEGLAHAYRIEDKVLVGELLRLPGLEAGQKLQILRYLPDAYIGKPEAISQVVKLAPPASRSELLGNIAAGIGTRSVTDMALGTRILSGLASDSPETRSVFASMVQEHSGRFPSSALTPVFTDIVQRMGTHGNLQQAERAWLQDQAVGSDVKAKWVRIRRSAGQTESRLMADIPQGQRSQVTVHLREGTNLDVFENLAKQKKRPTEEFTVAKRESFEFESFRFPLSGGKFRLGSPPDEAGRYDNESQRDVVLTKAFEMMATTVTQRQWELVMGNKQQPHFKGNPDNPMEMVSWEDGVAYAQRLSELDPRYNYRLPTEAEWEVAARAGTNTRFSHGGSDADLGQHAWTDANSGSKTHAVAELKPNANGLYDMHGNVWEWCADWYGSNLPEVVDPQGPISGSYRVVRGGSWYNGAPHARSALRSYDSPVVRNGDFGFRLVRTPK